MFMNLFNKLEFSIYRYDFSFTKRMPTLVFLKLIEICQKNDINDRLKNKNNGQNGRKVNSCKW